MSAPSGASRSLVARACAVTVAALAVLSCSGGGDPSSPQQDIVGDTYVIATATVLDANPPCTAFSCDPEFYDCQTLAGIPVGTTYVLRADVATAGLITVAADVMTIDITGTDSANRLGVAIELTANRTVSPPSYSYSSTAAKTFFDVDLECDTIFSGVPASRFTGFLPGPVTITEVTYDSAGAIIPAVPDGQGGFSPPGVFEGTFSFVGRLLQPTPGGSITAQVQVDGCFRVNLTQPERGIPVTRTPAGAPCP